ncbi:MAG TPA: hypothetical protein VKD67_11485, partial [Acidimicrobiales bacterium]|nr:hypothetical protein [Acidimicrobiales bacterium]
DPLSHQPPLWPFPLPPPLPGWPVLLEATVDAGGLSLDGGVEPAADSVGALPQSLCAAADTASPCPGPGGTL